MLPVYLCNSGSAEQRGGEVAVGPGGGRRGTGCAHDVGHKVILVKTALILQKKKPRLEEDEHQVAIVTHSDEAIFNA